MHLGIRGKIFLISLVLIIVVVLSSGLYVEHELQQFMAAQLEDEMLRLCRTARSVIEFDRAPFTGESADSLADHLGRSTGARVTVIGADGVVLGDSLLDAEHLKTVENHGNRPEVRAARERGYGFNSHFSTTVNMDMFYLAVPFTRPDATGFLRLAMPMRDIGILIHRLRVILTIAGLIGILLAVTLSGLSSYYMSRAFKTLVANVHALSRGERRRIAVTSRDEIGGLAGSINRMTDDLESVVSALATERDRFVAVLEGMTDAVLALDAQQRVVLVNHAALALLDLTEAPSGRTLLEVVRSPVLKDLLTKSGKGETAVGELDLPGPSSRRVLARVTPLRATGGNVLVMSDITDLRRLETIRRDFVANVSHELRTPVSVIRANAETLLGGAIEDRERAPVFVEAMHRNAERLTQILSDLLDLSRIESGRLVMDVKLIQIEPVIRRVAEMLEKAAQEKGHELAFEIAPDLGALADSKALEQVLLNLLDNAVKYTPASGRIIFRARKTEDGVRVEVADNGPGIELRHQTRIFERFYRVDPGRSRDMGGTGLGLSIVKHLVEVMGGRVGFESASPQGSIFWVLLKTPKEDA